MLYAVILCLLISCTIAHVPQQTFLTNASLSGISKVAIVVTVSAPDVSYSRDAQSVSANNPIPLLAFIGLLNTGVRSSIDYSHSSNIKERINFSYLEEKTAELFIQPLKQGGCFQTIVHVANKEQDDRQWATAGYDAVIHLFVREISLKRAAGDNVNLWIYVQGQMTSLASETIIWDREEFVSSSVPHPLDYYKENGQQEIVALLEKAIKKLDYDFVYLK